MGAKTATDRNPDAAAWRIFVISLADAYERRRRISEQCAELGLEFEIVAAVDGRGGLSAEFESRIDRNAAEARCGRPLSDGEFACALSHRSIYQRIADEGLPGAVVLEDDAILSSSFAEFIRHQGYCEADVVQMDYGPARVFWRQRRSWSNEIALAPLAENAHLTSGYSISARGARYMLAQTMPLAGLADWPCDMIPLRPLITVPRLVQQPEACASDSDLKSERDFLIENRDPIAARWRRFGRRDYWRRWWMKRRTRRIS